MSSPPLRALEREFRRQLLPGVGGLTTYADRYDAQLQRLREATPVQAKAEFARLGGVVKSWRQYLKQGITLAVLGSIRPGREHVLKWQLDRFGQSQTSAHLRQFADEARAGGGRGDEIRLSPALNDECAALFRRYKDALKRPPAPAGPSSAISPRPG